MLPKKIYSALITAALLAGCSDTSQNVAQKKPAAEVVLTSEQEYLPLLEELHALECEELIKGGKHVSDTAVYSFRAAAFHEVIRDLDRRILARYENLCQELANIEYLMPENEKAAYAAAQEKIYKRQCK